MQINEYLVPGIPYIYIRSSILHTSDKIIKEHDIYEHLYCYYSVVCICFTSAVLVNALQPNDTDGCFREEVRGVTAYRPSPNRGLRLGSDVRARGFRDGDSGSNAFARTRKKVMALDTCCYCFLQQYGTKESNTCTKICT